MFVLTRQMKGRIARQIVKRNPWISQWYLSENTKPSSVSWTGKLSDAQLFETSLLASDFRDNDRGLYSLLRGCTVQIISEKELFEAKLRNR